MGNSFKLHYWVSLMSALLSLNCSATDSTGVFQLGIGSNKLVSMGSQTVPDEHDDQCQNVDSLKQTNRYGDDPPIESACPPEYPLPRSIKSTVHGNTWNTDTIITLKCCKPEIKYKQQA